ncbi:MAG: cAMP-activated global transcriptional regulator CRP [Pseudomonadota bacterium]|nr:cAMP-activated global transcriptional regulator CRP [Pseudomonadota bacterium]
MSILVPIKRTSDPLIEEFLGHCRRAQYSAKALIITRGDPADELLYVIKGSVTVILEDDRGHEIVLAYLNSGQFFGETGLFVENIKRTAFVRARTKCEVAHVSYDRLRNFPAIYAHIVPLLATQIATRLLKTNRKVRDLAFLDVSGRIARTLLDLCKEPDAMTHPDGMQISVTRQELGRIVGCSREVVGRVLKIFTQQDLIQVKGKTIVVCGVR